MEDRLPVGVVRMGLGCAAVLAGAGWAGAQPTSGPFPLPALAPAPAGVPTYLDTTAGMEFSVVNTAGIVPYVSNREIAPRVIGANVPSYAISRTEVTQGQFVEFINAMAEVPLPPDGTGYQGQVGTLLYGGAFSVSVGFNEITPLGRPVWLATPLGAQLGAIPTWFGAAMYCNWLHNNRTNSLEAILSGAYDLRSMGQHDRASWAAITRQAGARYWIPSFDEAQIAAYWDPNRNGPGQQGWWQSVNGRDRLPISGPPVATAEDPNVGETSAEYVVPGLSPFMTFYPVGAYAEQQSPLGLFDTSGSVPEWTDTAWFIEGYPDNNREYRMRVGSSAGGDPVFPQIADLDGLARYGAEWPTLNLFGFRIATVPTPSSGAVLVALFIAASRRRR